jgi:hypothetical protein
MATYLNDLRLTELATGEGSGTWGTTTNLSLELIGEALGFATQQVFGSDADATTTIADGASDPARAMYFKITSAGSLTATRTCTIAPNTISRVMFIENATTGSQSIQISQGSGASVTILAGKTAVVYLDGAGSGAAVVDAMAGVDPGVTDTLAEVLAAGNTSGANNLIIDNGQAITTNTINETTAASGVTIDSVLLKDDGVNATNLEITNIKANDGTSAGSIADSTGVVTLASSVLTTADINGGTIDGTTLGATTPASVAATTGSFSSTLGVTGAATFSSTVRSTGYSLTDATSQYYHFDAASGNNFMGLTAAHTLTTYTNGVARTTLDANGNLGLGVVPSAWNSGYKAFQFGTVSSLQQGATSDTSLSNNYYVNSAGNALYLTSSHASVYRQASGAHEWYNAPSGTAGNPVTLTPAMTLDASGNLLVGTTSAFGTAGTTINSAGLIYSSADGDRSGQFDRTTDDGEIVRFSKAGTTVGSIGTGDGDLVVASRNSKGFKIYAPNADGTSSILHPSTDATGSPLDAQMSLGYVLGRFKDLYLSGSAYTPVVQGLGDEAGLTFGGAVVAPRKNNAVADGTVDLGASDARFKDLYLSGTSNVGVGRFTAQSLSHSAASLVLGHEGSSKSQIRAYGINAGTIGSLEFMVSAADGTGSKSMTLDASGNLLSGTTTSKGSRVQAAGAAASVSPTLGSATDTSLLLSNSDVTYGMNFGVINNGNGWIQQHSNTGTAAAYNLLLQPVGGNVGIGTSSPAEKLDISQSVNNSVITKVTNTNSGDLATARVEIHNNDSSFGQLTTYSSGFGYPVLGSSAANWTFIGSSGANSNGLKIGTLTTDPIVFGTNDTERARLTSDGNFLVGTSSASGKFTLEYNGSAVIGQNYNDSNDTNNSTFTQFAVLGVQAGTIKRVGTTSAVIYNTSSDYRLKTVISPVEMAGLRIDSLRPVEYEWKSNGLRSRGFLAHEFGEVYPSSVSGDKDAVDDNGNPVYQSMQASTSEVIADLVSEIQSLRARISQLEGAN